MKLRAVSTTFIACLIASSTACTISPKPVRSNMPSYSGNELTSGVVGGFAGGGYIVDDVFRAKWFALVEKYRADFPNAEFTDLKPLPNGFWYCDKETMVEYLAMNELNRSGILPKKQ